MATDAWAQLHQLLTCLYGGIAMGGWYDVLYGLRMCLRAGDTLTAVADLLFWLGAGTIAFQCVFYRNGGILSLAHLPAFALGAWLYRYTLSHFLRKGAGRLQKRLHQSRTAAVWQKFCKILKKLLQ